MRGRDINIDIDGGRSETLLIKPMAGKGEAWGLSGVTLVGSLRDIKTDTEVGELDCTVTEEGRALISFPAKEVGQYVFAVDMSGKDGESTRLIEGYVTWGAPKAVITDSEESEEQCLLVYVNGKRRRAVWAWSKEAERMYEAAKEAAKQAQEAAEAAKNAADSAKDSADSVDGKEVLDDLDVIEDRIDAIKLDLRSAIVPNTDTNTWWIAGEDTHVQVTGDRGRDGLDGTTIRRVLLGEGEELPIPKTEAEAEKLRGTFYVQHNGDDYSVFTLLETAGGQYEWVDVGETNLPATETLYGLVKLGTNSVLTGAPVGCDSNDQLTVGTATPDKYGVVKLGGGLGLDASGKVYVKEASFSSYGIVLKDQSLADEKSADVPTTNAVRAWLGQHYYDIDATYPKTAVYSKSETYSKNETYSKTEVDKKIGDASYRSPFVLLTEDEYAALEPVSGILYLIPEK